MYKQKIYPYFIAAGLAFSGCKAPALVQHDETLSLPSLYEQAKDTANTATVQWKDFFADPYLDKLIDTAIKNNQELLITLQEIEIARNDIRVRKGELLPSVHWAAGAGVEKVGRYTSQGAGDASTEIKPGKEMPELLGDFMIGAYANWEVDIWKKLRTAKKAAITRYLATVEGKNFVVTNLVAEIANSYYELLSLDNQLEIVRETIRLQKNALEIVKAQKEAARATELAVKKFEAEVLNSQSLEFDILQKTKETENKINFLAGRYPQPVARTQTGFLAMAPRQIHSGIPSQLLINRPDIRQAELELAASKLDVQVARTAFYPSFGISAGLGVQAFNPTYLVKMPESILFSLAGDLVGPLVNKNAIKAAFATADAKQVQAMYNYQKTILSACMEVSNQLSNLDNLDRKYTVKSKEVEALTRSIDIANDLFKSARADYLEVLMTQRDALVSKLELIETRERQLVSVTNIYRALGGGWK